MQDEIQWITQKNGHKVKGYEMKKQETHQFNYMIQKDIPFDIGEDYKWVKK